MKTYLPKEDEIQRNWLIVDAEDAIMGRLAVKVADLLRGKNKPTYTPHLDCGDHVIVVNAEKVKLTGRKESGKTYQDFSGYMGGQKVQTARQVRASKPSRLVRDAVWGMMPKGRLGRRQFRKLKVYAGAEHPHEAQTPIKLELD
ncbi:MAG: 50S ribosomal protein L13 [Lentisphaeria bacterium]